MEEFSIEQQEELKADLLRLREELTAALEQASSSAQAVKLDQQVFGRVSRMDAIQQQSMAQATQTQYQNMLRKILKALARIDAGDYGYCLECDELIGFLRLKARPETAFCLKCQTKREQA